GNAAEERQNLRTPKLLAQNRRSLCIDPVHLKNMLRQVQSDRSNLAHGWLPFAADSITAVWHSDAARRPSTPSFNHLVRSHEHAGWHGQAERPGGLKGDDRFVLSRCLHWKVGGLNTAQDAVDIGRSLPKLIGAVDAVA